MRGKDAETLEDTVMETYSKMHALQDIQMEHRDRIKLLQTTVNASFNKIVIVKYIAFDGMGAQSSFVLAVLDQKNNGFLLNAMHSRTSCYIYIKEINSLKIGIDIPFNLFSLLFFCVFGCLSQGLGWLIYEPPQINDYFRLFLKSGLYLRI